MLAARYEALSWSQAHAAGWWAHEQPADVLQWVSLGG